MIEMINILWFGGRSKRSDEEIFRDLYLQLDAIEDIDRFSQPDKMGYKVDLLQHSEYKPLAEYVLDEISDLDLMLGLIKGIEREVKRIIKALEREYHDLFISLRKEVKDNRILLKDIREIISKEIELLLGGIKYKKGSADRLKPRTDKIDASRFSKKELIGLAEVESKLRDQLDKIASLLDKFRFRLDDVRRRQRLKENSLPRYSV